MKNEIVAILLDAWNESTQFVSGEKLSRHFGVTRAAVSKTIQNLVLEGLPVERVKHHGYRLTRFPDMINEVTIRHALHRAGSSRFAQSEIRAFDQIDSTNLAARRGVEAGDPDGTIYIASTQTAGRGRRGKSWLSPEGDGLWFSLLLRPDQLPGDVARITLFSGLCATLAMRERTGLDIQLKWPNDLVVLPSGRKLAGILTEMTVEENHIVAVIIGIGLNIRTTQFPDELSTVATSVALSLAERSAIDPADPRDISLTRPEILAAIVSQFEKLWPTFDFVNSNAGSATSVTGQDTGPDWMNTYRTLCATLNRPVQVSDNRGTVRTGQAVGLAGSGDLIVQWPDGLVEHVTAGEVSVRGLLGT